MSRESIIKHKNFKTHFYIAEKLLYDYSILESLTKYKPLVPMFYHANELMTNYNILKNVKFNDKIFIISSTCSFLEYIRYTAYKYKNINTICFNNTKAKYIQNLKSIYAVDILEEYLTTHDIITNLCVNSNEKYQQSALVIYDIHDDKHMTNLDMNTFIGMIIGLKYTLHDGSFILHFGDLSSEIISKIYMKMSKYFKNASLYYPEISNHYEPLGIYGIFTGFKGCNHNEIAGLLDKLISGNLELELEVDKLVDQYIKNFVTLQNNKITFYLTKLENYLDIDKSILDKVNIPTDEQLTNSILYCQKWKIPFWDKYTTKPFQNKFGRMILAETYGLHQPILYQFKTPYKFHTISRITLRIPSRSRSTSRISRISHQSKIKINIKSKSRSRTKHSGVNITDLLHDLSFTPSKFRTSSKSRYRISVNLSPELEYSNNRIEQVGRLIDARRDFTKLGDNQYVKWWEINKKFRYYKHKDDLEKIHLDQLIRTKLKDNSISQAWLKMYEIITDNNLISTDKKGTFHSFHICEAPGTFINAINNFIHTKTKYTTFDWHSQSLNPKIATIKDQFGLIKRHPDRWDYGADGTGDITKIANIKHYKRQVVKRGSIDLMTSDCGLAMKESGYEKVAFASLLAILEILSLNGAMVYKILTPIDEPIILNLIYVIYCNFKEVVFYKPVQNNQSREFYIVAKGYLGTHPDILSKFYTVLKTFDTVKEKDLFNDKYPEAFVRQFVDISNQLADNYIYTIERNIYYLDNFDDMSPEFIKLMKKYYDEKNQDWIDKYKPMRINGILDKL